MSHSTFRRSKLNTLLGLATAGLLLATAPVHAQTATENSKADSQSGKPASGTMNKQGASSGAESPARSEAGKPSSSTSGSSQASGASGSSGAADAKAGSDAKAAGGKLGKADQDMMKKIAQTNIAEIESGKLAQEKSKSDEVRSFAKKMVDDHTKAQGELEKIAQSKGVTLPSEPDAKHQTAMKKLGTLSGAEFDKQYMKQAGVEDHREAHKLLQRVSKQAKDDELKQYAATTLQAVDQHGKMAKDMKGGQSSGGSADKGATGSSGASAEKGATGSSGASADKADSGATAKPSTEAGKSGSGASK